MAERFVGVVELDWLLLAGRHTLLEQTGTAELFPRCEDLGIRVLAAAVLNSGILADPVAGRALRLRAGARRGRWRAPSGCRRCAPGTACRSRRRPCSSPCATPRCRWCSWAPATVAEVEEDARLLELAIPAACWDDLAAEGVPL